MYRLVIQISLIFLGLLFAYIYFKPDKLHPQARSRNQSVVAMSRAGAHGGRVSTTQRPLRPPLSLFELMTLSLVAMLFVFYVFLILAKFAWWPLLTGFFPGCIAVGVAIQASFLSAHFWLNAMNYTVWRGLRQMRVSGSAGGGGGTADRDRRYRWYAAYAWGSPAAMVVVTLIMQVGIEKRSANADNAGFLLLLLLLLPLFLKE